MENPDMVGMISVGFPQRKENERFLDLPPDKICMEMVTVLLYAITPSSC
jgi:hypothetical protein